MTFQEILRYIFVENYLFVVSVVFVLILRVILSRSRYIAEKSAKALKKYAIVAFTNLFAVCLLLGKKFELIPCVMLSLVTSVITVIVIADVVLFCFLIVRAIVQHKKKKRKE